MKLRKIEIDTIDTKKPFEKCVLDREKYAEVLTSIIQSSPEGFVMALNNEWGTGKTTFIKMWNVYLSEKEFHTIYFNAWENDFDLEPLVAIISEIKKELKIEDESSRLQQLLENGGTLIKNIIPAAFKGLITSKLGVEVGNIAEATLKGATEIMKTEIELYNKRKESLSRFKIILQELIKCNSNKPVVFFIDELDRCNPRYSVTLLEQIKHLFSVENIVFILSIDKQHLASSIKGYYGSSEINTNEYLRRFIDIEYSLPEPDRISYITFLWNEYQYDIFFKDKNRNSIFDGVNEKESFIKMLSTLSQKNNLTLRQINSLMAFSKLVISSFNYNNYIKPQILAFLIFVKHYHGELFTKIMTSSLSMQEFVEENYLIFPIVRERNINNEYIFMDLVVMYDNQLSSKPPYISIYKDDRTSIAINIPNMQGDRVMDLFKRIKYEVDGNMQISLLTNKIALLESLNLKYLLEEDNSNDI